MSADTTNVPYNPYYDLETGVQQLLCVRLRSVVHDTYRARELS